MNGHLNQERRRLQADARRFAMDEVLPLITTGRVRVEPLVTHTFPLEDYGAALHMFAERVDGALKVLIQPEKS